MRLAESATLLERSGSCALVLLFVDETCYIANVGDSRAVLSAEMGSKVFALSYDHKPDGAGER
jgi:protein phosphatase 2C family protein 2/3